MYTVLCVKISFKATAIKTVQKNEVKRIKFNRITMQLKGACLLIERNFVTILTMSDKYKTMGIAAVNRLRCFSLLVIFDVCDC